MNNQQPATATAMAPGTKVTCKNCPRTFELEEPAPHKKFCSKDCRIEWHNKQRKLGLAVLAQLQSSESKP